MKIKKKYQINKNYIMKKIKISYLQDLKCINKRENPILNK